MSKVCSNCGRAAGRGKRELRPYGPGGSPICAGCVFGENDSPANPKLLKTAEKQLKKKLDAIQGPAVLTDEGPETL